MHEQTILTRIARRLHVTLNVNKLFDEQSGSGERQSDRSSACGGSWRFITLSGSVLMIWIVLITELLAHDAFDTYPFILLNLVLSMLAAIQAPVKQRS